MKQSYKKRRRIIEILIHIIGWGGVFAFPLLFFSRNGEAIDWMTYLRHSVTPFTFMLIFYLNYFFIIPRYLFSEHLHKYVLSNILLILIIGILLHLWQEFSFAHFVKEEVKEHPRPPEWIFFLRDTLSMILTVSLSAVIRISSRWREIEAARREAEKERAEAELKNLRNQLNPHFLLNTLNNIYALIAFDTDKAQLAVQELSRLLRHVLYDNQQTYVSLGKEMDFIRNYIELMRIRLSSNVKVETQITINPDSRTQIAPLIFISLIENAFKHGISPTEPNHIRIFFSETENDVHCEITNSYHPKAEADKSGSGIGLEQVNRRLELLYPNNYVWRTGVSKDGKEYTSRLTIHCTNHK